MLYNNINILVIHTLAASSYQPETGVIMGHSNAGVNRRARAKRRKRVQETNPRSSRTLWRQLQQRSAASRSSPGIIMDEIDGVQFGIQTADIPPERIIMDEIDGLEFGIQTVEVEVVNPND